MRHARAGAAALLIALAPPPHVAAHPHIFVECGVVVVLGAEGLEGIRIAWS
jgi:ABC-type uncharacterized transport system substrate-binding protein